MAAVVSDAVAAVGVTVAADAHCTSLAAALLEDDVKQT